MTQQQLDAEEVAFALNWEKLYAKFDDPRILKLAKRFWMERAEYFYREQEEINELTEATERLVGAVAAYRHAVHTGKNQLQMYKHLDNSYRRYEHLRHPIMHDPDDLAFRVNLTEVAGA